MGMDDRHRQSTRLAISARPGESDIGLSYVKVSERREEKEKRQLEALRTLAERGETP